MLSIVFIIVCFLGCRFFYYRHLEYDHFRQFSYCHYNFSLLQSVFSAIFILHFSTLVDMHSGLFIFRIDFRFINGASCRISFTSIHMSCMFSDVEKEEIFIPLFVTVYFYGVFSQMRYITILLGYVVILCLQFGRTLVTNLLLPWTDFCADNGDMTSFVDR